MIRNTIITIAIIALGACSSKKLSDPKEEAEPELLYPRQQAPIQTQQTVASTDDGKARVIAIDRKKAANIRSSIKPANEKSKSKVDTLVDSFPQVDVIVSPVYEVIFTDKSGETLTQENMGAGFLVSIDFDEKIDNPSLYSVLIIDSQTGELFEEVEGEFLTIKETPEGSQVILVTNYPHALYVVVRNKDHAVPSISALADQTIYALETRQAIQIHLTIQRIWPALPMSVAPLALIPLGPATCALPVTSRSIPELH